MELSEPASAPETLEIADRKRILTLAIENLSEGERAMVVLHDIEGPATVEVAGVLSTREVTVRSQLSKTREKIRRFAERYLRRRS